MQKPETRPRRKSKVPADAFWIAEEHHRPVFVDYSDNRYKDAAAAYYKLLELVFPSIGDENQFSAAATMGMHGTVVPRTGFFYPKGFRSKMHVAPQAHQEAASKLFITFQAAIEAAYQAGAERGKDLLIQLAKGNITAKQLNDLALEDEA